MKQEERRLKAALNGTKAPELTKSQRQSLDRLIEREARRTEWTPEKSFLRRVWEQAAYLSPLTWVLQLAVPAFGLFLLMAEESMPVSSLSAFIPLLGLIGVPELAKSFSSGMWELEESCFYNLRQVILLKMLLFGIVDGGMLLAMMGAAGRQGCSAAEAFYYIVVPFNLSTAGYLGLFHVLKRRCDGFVLTAAGILMVFFGMAAGRYRIFSMNAVEKFTGRGGVWLTVAVSAVLLAGVGYYMIYQFDREEERLWSLG